MKANLYFNCEQNKNARLVTHNFNVTLHVMRITCNVKLKL